MNNYGRFGALLGTIFVGNTTCKFSVYAAQNAEVLTCHEIPLVQISNRPGWIEFDPAEIWKCVLECIKTSIENLVILDINPSNIIAVGVTNQRETTVLWHRSNGMPIHNAIAWNDTRTSSTVNTILSKIRNKKNYLKSVCGLPLSNCFSAIKIKWIIDNVDGTIEAIRSNDCLFGTLDTWILWNLTGGTDGGIHVTDVTNASRTMLMNLDTLQWDHKLCAFFKIPMTILPQIRSCSEIYGLVHSGPMHGIPIASSLGEQPAALLGQMCTQTSQVACTFDEGCFLFVNTGQQIIDSEHGLLTTVAFQLGPLEKPVFALEGAFSNAGAAMKWLQLNMSVNNEINQSQHSVMVQSLCTTAVDTSTISSFNSNSSNCIRVDPPASTNVVFVPAFSGLYSPFWKHNARGLILGLNHSTTAREVTLAAYEAICYQTRDILESLKKDLPNWTPLDKLIVGGEFSENSFFLQLLADLCGVIVERPQTTSPSCLGSMLAAGVAMKVFTLEKVRSMIQPPSDVFQSTLSTNKRNFKYARWKFAIKKCLAWDYSDDGNDYTSMSFQDQDPELAVRCSIPGGIFLISSIALLLITKFLQQSKTL